METFQAARSLLAILLLYMKLQLEDLYLRAGIYGTTGCVLDLICIDWCGENGYSNVMLC